MHTTDIQIAPRITLRSIFGPAFVLVSLSLLALKGSTLFPGLSMAAFLGLLLCWKWEMKGFALALAAFAVIVLYQWTQSALPTVWESGLMMSLTIAFFITTLARGEIEEVLQAYSEMQNLKNQHDKDLLEARAKYQERTSEMHRLQEQVTASEAHLKKLIGEQETQVSDLNDQLEKLVDKLHQLESEKEKLKQEIEKAVEAKKQTQTERSALPEAASDKDFARLQGMYRQLREQFDEKSEILDATRRELFAVQEEVNRLEMLYNEEIWYDGQGTLRAFESLIVGLEEKCRQQEEEIDALQEFITKNGRN